MRTSILNNKINLLHIIGSVYQFGGLERKVIQLINNLDRSNFRVVLVSLAKYEDEQNNFINDDVSIYSLNKRDGINVKIIKRLVKILKKNEIHIIHSHNWATLFYAVIAAKMAGTPIIIHGEHGIETKNIQDNYKQFLAKKILYHLCHHLIGISKDIKKSLIQRYKIPDEKITVIHNGVETKEHGFNKDKNTVKEKYNLQRFSTIIGTVGRIKPVKDFITLIRAFAIVKKVYPDSALVIVGPGNDETNPYYIKLNKFINDMDIHDVFFTGTIDNIPEILSVFNLFVNSSLSEGISNTILEAMANKVPVVASRAGGNPELVAHEKSGLLFECQNEKECADSVLEILKEPALREAYVDSAYENVMQNHTMESMFQKNTTLYKKLLYSKQKWN